MKRLLLVFVALALAMLACQPNGPTPEPVVIVVTATPAPMKIAPTPVPAQSVDIPTATRDYLLGEGFHGPTVEATGTNGCTAEFCIHYNKGTIAISHYYNHGELTGLVMSFATADMSEYTGTIAGSVMGYDGIPSDAVDALLTKLQTGGGGNPVDVPSGWRINAGEQNGRVFLVLTIPGKNVGSSTSTNSA